MEVLSRPVTGMARRPSTRNRVELKGLSSMRAAERGDARRSGPPSRRRWPPRSDRPWPRSAAAAVVEGISSVATSGRCAASHCRHWARPCGWEQTFLTSPSSPARDSRCCAISSVSSPRDQGVGVDQAVERDVDRALRWSSPPVPRRTRRGRARPRRRRPRWFAPGRKAAEEPKRARAAWCVKRGRRARGNATGSGFSSASEAERISRQIARTRRRATAPDCSATRRSRTWASRSGTKYGRSCCLLSSPMWRAASAR